MPTFRVEGVMRAAYPAWAHVMPMASYSHNISIVVAAAVGAISGMSVVLSLANDPRTATEPPSASVRAIVTREPAAKVRTVDQDRSNHEQMPQSKIEQMPQPVPDVTGSDNAATAGRQLVLPDEERAQDDLPVATHRHLYWRRVRRFPTPNHW